MLKASFGKVLTAVSLSTTLFAQVPTEKTIRDGRPSTVEVKLQKNIERFSSAVEAYRAAVASNAELEKPLKEMEQAVGGLENYFRTRETPKVNKSDFAALSRLELAAETLKSANRLRVDLPGLLRIAEDPSIVIGQAADARNYIADLRRESVKLKFLIAKTRSSR